MVVLSLLILSSDAVSYKDKVFKMCPHSARDKRVNYCSQIVSGNNEATMTNSHNPNLFVVVL